MGLNRELVLTSLLSGAVSVGAYVLVQKYMCCNNSKQKQTNEPKHEPSKIYEEKALLDQYMMFNFADENEFLLFDLGNLSDIKNCLNFPQKVGLLCREYCPDIFFYDDVIHLII